MLPFRFDFPADRPPRILCLGAHCDDIEIGAGGTILRLLAAHPDAAIRWVVFSSTPPRRVEAEAAAAAFLAGAGEARVEIHDFRDGFLPWNGQAVKEVFETLKDPAPDLILTHTRDDRHQDHRLVCELTWNTFRHHAILEYEIPKYDGDLGRPGMYQPLDEATARRKCALLLEHFATQRAKHWFTEDTFLALMRLRGLECAATYAEAFHCPKGVLA